MTHSYPSDIFWISVLLTWSVFIAISAYQTFHDSLTPIWGILGTSGSVIYGQKTVHILKNGLFFLSRNDASSIPRNWIFWTDKIDSIKNLSWQWNTVRIPSFLPNSWILVSFNCIELKMIIENRAWREMVFIMKFCLYGRYFEIKKSSKDICHMWHD